MLAFLSAVTSTIELNTAMCLVTLRHPVLVAKQKAEIDLLSRGRLRRGVSVGWNREEQLALGADPATRARRLDETVPLLRRLWTEDAVSHDGEFFRVDGVGIHPRPDRTIPVWIGGGGLGTGGKPLDLSPRRAARLGDGFKFMAPTGSDDGPEGDAVAERLHAYAADLGRTIEVEARLVTQMTLADQWASVIRRYRESGLITHVGLGNRIVGGPVESQIALIRDLVDRTHEEW